MKWVSSANRQRSSQFRLADSVVWVDETQWILIQLARLIQLTTIYYYWYPNEELIFRASNVWYKKTIVLNLSLNSSMHWIEFYNGNIRSSVQEALKILPDFSGHLIFIATSCPAFWNVSNTGKYDGNVFVPPGTGK